MGFSFEVSGDSGGCKAKQKVVAMIRDESVGKTVRLASNKLTGGGASQHKVMRQGESMGQSRASQRSLALLGLALVALALAASDFWAMNEERNKMAAWASWIGELPTAAELYGDAANDVPTTEAFDDDDDDEELDASATNEYPDNEQDSDEAYEDADGK